LRVAFKKSFVKDLEKLRDAKAKSRVRNAVLHAEAAEALQELGDIRRLRGGEQAYRIRVGDYRLGLILEGNTIVFVRCLHRKDLYRYFP
jgi:mRNA interferase RelE/StbE